VKSEKLLRRPGGVAADCRISQFQPVAEQQTDLHVSGDQPEKGPERRLGVRKVEKPGLPAGFQHRLQPPGQREAAILQHDGAKVILARPRMTDRHPVERDRGIARDDAQPIRRESLQARGQRGKVEPLAVDLRHPHLGGLPLHRRRQQPVEVAEPLVERFLGTARPPRHGGHGQVITFLDQQAKGRIQNGLLPLRQCFAVVDVGHGVQHALPRRQSTLANQRAVPYVTVLQCYAVLR
jgi:hypothetical protein